MDIRVAGIQSVPSREIIGSGGKGGPLCEAEGKVDHSTAKIVLNTDAFSGDGPAMVALFIQPIFHIMAL